jgi:hypothetical protein
MRIPAIRISSARITGRRGHALARAAAFRVLIVERKP